MGAEPRKTYLESYMNATRSPLYSLVLVLPLVLVYEVVLLVIRSYSWRHVGVLADELIVVIGERLGMEHVRVFPAFLVLGTLFFLQFRSGKKWDFRFSYALLMHVEYALYGAVFFLAAAWIFPGTLGFTPPRLEPVILSLGAGIYEEFLFRLVLLSLLIYLFGKVLKVEQRRTVYCAVVLSAVGFAGFHYWLGTTPFLWGEFLVRTAAGVYFGVIYVTRGYGTAAGTHICFNVLLTIYCS